MKFLHTIINRIYSDYFMPARLDEYEKIIIEALRNGYEFASLKEYFSKLKAGSLGGKKYFVQRHDIDTDVDTAKLFFEIETRHSVKATYYFRLSTLDLAFMRDIERFGSEASYHFEEIATHCKSNHIKSQEAALSQLDVIRAKFKENFRALENTLGFKLKTVSSHGDFVNRALKLANLEITKSAPLREELQICCETYDKELMDSFDSYISDRPYPELYYPDNIFVHIGKSNRIYMLTHPRQWRTNFWINTADNIRRLYEGLRW